MTRKTRLPVAEGHGQVAVSAVLSPWHLIWWRFWLFTSHDQHLYTFVGTALYCSRLMHSGVWRMSTCAKATVDEDALVSVSGWSIRPPDFAEQLGSGFVLWRKSKVMWQWCESFFTCWTYLFLGVECSPRLQSGLPRSGARWELVGRYSRQCDKIFLTKSLAPWRFPKKKWRMKWTSCESLITRTLSDSSNGSSTLARLQIAHGYGQYLA